MPDSARPPDGDGTRVSGTPGNPLHAAATEIASPTAVTPGSVAPSDATFVQTSTVLAKGTVLFGAYEIVDAPHSHAAAEQAVELVREGRAEALMKGSLHTHELMGAVVG